MTKHLVCFLLGCCVAIFGPGGAVLAQQSSNPPSEETVRSLLTGSWFLIDQALTAEAVAEKKAACEKPLILETKLDYYWPKTHTTDLPGLDGLKGSLGFLTLEANVPIKMMAVAPVENPYSGFTQVFDLSHMRVRAAASAPNYTVATIANEYTYSGFGWKETRNKEVLKTVPFELAVSNALLEDKHMMFSAITVADQTYGLLYYPVGRDGAILNGQTHQYLRCDGMAGVILPN